jgi:hypothetical protein
VECSSNIRDCFCVKRVRQIDAQKLCAERTRCQPHFKSGVSHGNCSRDLKAGANPAL